MWFNCSTDFASVYARLLWTNYSTHRYRTIQLACRWPVSSWPDARIAPIWHRTMLLFVIGSSAACSSLLNGSFIRARHTPTLHCQCGWERAHVHAACSIGKGSWKTCGWRPGGDRTLLSGICSGNGGKRGAAGKKNDENFLFRDFSPNFFLISFYFPRRYVSNANSYHFTKEQLYFSKKLCRGKSDGISIRSRWLKWTIEERSTEEFQEDSVFFSKFCSWEIWKKTSGIILRTGFLENLWSGLRGFLIWIFTLNLEIAC